MNDNNLRLQVILNAVDKLTRPFRAAQASSKELAGAIQNTRNSLKELNKQAGRIDEFRKTRSQLAITANNLNAAREEAAKLATQFAATNRPTAAQAKLFSQAKTRVQELQQTYNGLLGAVQRQRQALKESGIDTRQLSSAQRELKKNAEETRQALEGQKKALKRLGEQQARMNAAREQYSRRLEVRDRIAGAGATTTAAGLAMGAPVMAAVKSYTSMEDAMKGVAKQVNGLRDDNGNRTARFYEMQDAIKAASEQLPMENGAVDFAALVEGGARMNVANPDDSWEDQKRDLLAFASTAAKAATAFELPADELSESLGKIAQLYKIPTRNIEQLGDALNYLDDNAMSKGADIIDVMQRLGGVADRLDYRKAAALGSTFLTLGAAPEVAASAANAMVRELSIATMQSKSFFEGMNLLKLNPEVIEKQMTKDAMGTIQRVLEKGAFTVDEIEHTGAPDRLTIRARSADFRETLNTRREKSWHKTTVGEVVKEIAARHKLKMALGKDLSDKPVEHIDQTNESDGSFLMRLARQYGAIASVKNGNLLFIRQGQGKSATGKPLPVITITRKDGDSHRFTLADRGAYTGVIASWLHTREPAKKESTTVKRKRRTKKQKKEPEAKQGDYLVGTDENVLVLNRTYANRGNAERAAKMQWERLQRGVASFSLQLAEGRADLYTEMPVKVSGFKQPIDDAEWTITTLTHTVSPDNGFTTSLELEVRIDDFEME